MRFKTSYSKEKLFNGTLFRKNLTRFWPLWAVYALIWFFLGPMNQFLILFNPTNSRNFSVERLAADAIESLLENASGSGLILAVIAGPLFAMALFSYLYSARSVGMMHSFPIRRNTLFLTNYCAGLTVIGATLLTNAVLIAIVQGIAGILVWKIVAQWFLCTIGEMIFFYSFAVFCGVFTGVTVALPAFYALLNGVAEVLDITINGLAERFLYGYSYGRTPEWAKWLTPVAKLRTNAVYTYDMNVSRDIPVDQRLINLHVVVIYLLVGFVFAAVALIIYQRRQSETAGDVVSVRWAKQLFRFGAGFFSAVTLGQILYSVIHDSFFTSSMGESLPLMLVCLLVFALIGFYAAEMLLEKSFRVFRKAWKGAVLAAALPVLLCVGIKMDFWGFEKQIPVTDETLYISLSVNSSWTNINGTEDQELIQRILKLHQGLIDRKEENKAAEKKAYEEGLAGQEDRNMDDVYIRFNYYYKDGDDYKSIDRSYYLWYDYADLSDPDSLIAQLAAIYAAPEFQLRTFLNIQEEEDGVEATAETFLKQIIGGSLTYEVSPLEDNAYVDQPYQQYNFGEDDARAVAKAYLRDIKAGHVGQNAFGKDSVDHEYSNELELQELTGYSSYGDEPIQHPNFYNHYIRFTDSCTETVAELKRIGIVNESRQLYTNAERRAMEN